MGKVIRIQSKIHTKTVYDTSVLSNERGVELSHKAALKAQMHWQQFAFDVKKTDRVEKVGGYLFKVTRNQDGVITNAFPVFN